MFCPKQTDQNKSIFAVHSKPLPIVIVFVVICAQAYSQQDLRNTSAPAAVHAPRPRILSKQEGQSIVAVARNSQPGPRDRTDCSHLVHDVYQRAGFPYAYADSKDLYQGINSFVPVRHPQAGDLIVWRGHVGIVLSPRHRTFFSALSHGPATDRYNARYWKRRGLPRFYRYIEAAPSRAALRPE